MDGSCVVAGRFLASRDGWMYLHRSFDLCWCKNGAAVARRLVFNIRFGSFLSRLWEGSAQRIMISQDALDCTYLIFATSRPKGGGGVDLLIYLFVDQSKQISERCHREIMPLAARELSRRTSPVRRQHRNHRRTCTKLPKYERFSNQSVSLQVYFR